MKKLEIILIVLLLLGISFVFLHYPGGVIISTFAAVVLSVIYAYLGFAFFNGIKLRKIGKKISYSGLNKSMIINSIIIGIGFSVVILGLLFQLMDWPGSDIFFIIGFSFSVLGCILIFLVYKSSIFPIKRIALPRFLLFVLLAILLTHFNWEKRLEMNYKDHPDYIEAVKASHKDPQNRELRDKVDEERRKMNGEELGD